MESNVWGGRKSVVVPGITAPSSLACLRSFARRGIRTIVVSSDERTPSFRSRYCDEAVVVPSPHENLLAYRDALLSLAKRPDVQTIVPVREPDIYVLAAYRDEFADHIGTPWPDLQTLARVQDRIELFDTAAEAGVSIPETTLCTEVPDPDRQWIVKPRYSILTAEYVDRYGPKTCLAPPSTRYLEFDHADDERIEVAPASGTPTPENGSTDSPLPGDDSATGSSTADFAGDVRANTLTATPTSSTHTAAGTTDYSHDHLDTDGGTSAASPSPLAGDDGDRDGDATDTRDTSDTADTTATADTAPATNTGDTTATADTTASTLESLHAEMRHTPIVQEYVPTSDEYAFFALYDRGEPVATFQHRQRRGYSYAGGPSSYRESVRIPALEEAGRTLLDALEWHGLAMVEFLRDEETGEFKLMEINPRFWSSLPFTVQTGADFPYYYWLLATGEDERIDHSYEVGIGGHLLRGELLHLHSILTADVPLVEKPRFSTALWDVCRSIVAEPRFDYLSRTDPKPFVRDLLNAAQSLR
ncbi:ATP-grasp domain-containing protein [Natrialba sp. SSL1]|uniref:carboxylate--amine ligase n=1 Tax=Natrialba sp. SSL1 TaxID=1869245 RepID=UPI0008F870A6|nr:ATP-grasp domain-containing protein [Natrialba sp. SSL1]OIB58367.1 carboxylate--amine ligase [Natrialba sp. SSL1]